MAEQEIWEQIEFVQGSVRKRYIKLSDEQDGLKAMRSYCLGRKMLGLLLKIVKLVFREETDQHLHPWIVFSFL